MDIEINSIKKDEDKISPCDFNLPHQESFIGILKSSLEENPLLGSIKDRINIGDLRSIKIRINVITEGSSFFLPKQTNYAGIDFVDYFNNKINPVVLQLSFGGYMGIHPLLLKGLIDKQNKSGNESEIREEISKYNPEPRGIQWTLFHEFGHLIDALDPEFGYSNEAYKMIEKEKKQHYIFDYLWNCYLNRRLQRILKWKDQYSYERIYLQEAGEFQNVIWATSKMYNFQELANHSLRVFKKNKKQVAGK